MMESAFTKRIGNAAIAFRGYNTTNLGKTPELLAHPVYGPIVESALVDASQVCAAAIKRPIDLVERVRSRAETSLDTYAEDLTMIVAVELAQLKVLEQVFNVRFVDAQMAFGYSLGEIAALIACGVYTLEAALTPLLTLSDDAVELAADVQMGIVFSRGPALNTKLIQTLCLEISNEGHGVVAVSSYLSPNTVLLLGQGKTISMFKKRMRDRLPTRAHLKTNPDRWPPLHTPITWQRNIPNRAGVMLDTAPGGFVAPHPPIVSFVTGKSDYDEISSRNFLNRWVDHPQRVWDVVTTTLHAGVETVIHTGPEPNILPATFNRLSNNVITQLGERSLASYGLRAMSHIVRRRSWLSSMVSQDASLLRAPFVEQIILEDWLLEQKVK